MTKREHSASVRVVSSQWLTIQCRTAALDGGPWKVGMHRSSQRYEHCAYSRSFQTE